MLDWKCVISEKSICYLGRAVLVMCNIDQKMDKDDQKMDKDDQKMDKDD